MRDELSFVLDNVSIAGGLDYVNRVIRLPIKHGISREQHSAWELFSYKEDSNEAAFAVAAMCMCSTTVTRNAVTTSMAITRSIHQGLGDKAKGNVLGMVIVRDQSGNTLRVSQSRFYNVKLVQTLLKGHFILSLEGSLSGYYDVKKNGKWSCIYGLEAKSIRWSARDLT
nr:zinc finger, CCHC-type [Tanacetum cinerariifolium]